jgi:hypothetical protein
MLLRIKPWQRSPGDTSPRQSDLFGWGCGGRCIAEQIHYVSAQTLGQGLDHGQRGIRKPGLHTALIRSVVHTGLGFSAIQHRCPPNARLWQRSYYEWNCHWILIKRTCRCVVEYRFCASIRKTLLILRIGQVPCARVHALCMVWRFWRRLNLDRSVTTIATRRIHGVQNETCSPSGPIEFW